jgi:hypothetical protein
VDALFGRAGSDILIPGSTDLNAEGLAAIHARWNGSGNFNRRADAITTGNGVVGGVALNTQTVNVDLTTSNFLAGQGGSVLYFVGGRDKIADDVARGRVIQIVEAAENT